MSDLNNEVKSVHEEIDFFNIDKWDFIDYPCREDHLANFLAVVLHNWQRICFKYVKDFAKMPKVSFTWRKKLATYIIEEMNEHIVYRGNVYMFLVWMGKDGKINISAMSVFQNEVGIPHLMDSVLSGTPAAIIRYDGNDVYHVQTMFPILHHINKGDVFRTSEWRNCSHQFDELCCILFKTRSDAKKCKLMLDGSITSIPDTTLPTEYATYWEFDEYLYVYRNTNPTMTRFVEYCLNTLHNRDKENNTKVLADTLERLRAYCLDED